MHRSSLCRCLALLAAHVLYAACTDDGEGSNGSSAAGMVAAGAQAAGTQAAAGGGASGMTGGAGKLSFAADVYDQVIRAKCSACHSDAPSMGGLALFPGAATAYANLVGVPAGAAEGNACRNAGVLRVQPGEPDKSLIYLKLTMPICGSVMPPAAVGQTTTAQVELVRKWIAEGAAP